MCDFGLVVLRWLTSCCFVFLYSLFFSIDRDDWRTPAKYPHFAGAVRSIKCGERFGRQPMVFFGLIGLTRQRSLSVSSAIPPAGGQSSLANLRHSLQGARVRSAEASSAQPAAATASPENRDAADVSSSLAQVKTLLAELDAQAAIVARADDSTISQAQQRLNEISASIDGLVNRAAAPGRSAAGSLAAGPGSFTVDNVADGIRKYSIQQAAVAPGESLDVNVVITQSAQQGALFLSTGGNLDLSSNSSQFSFEIGGSKGNASVSFASGTSLPSVVIAINSLTPHTGVSAIVSGAGFRLDGVEVGKKNFVSVKVIDDGGLSEAAPNAGVFKMRTDDLFYASIETFVPLSAALGNEIADQGQDIIANINGQVANVDGTTLSVRSLALTARFTLTKYAALSVGKFTAFTITGVAETASSSLAQDIRSGLGLAPSP